MKLKQILLLISLPVFLSHAQDIFITGKVTDTGGQPVADATVSLAGQDLSKKTSASGDYELRGDVVILNNSGKQGKDAWPYMHGNVLSFTCKKPEQQVRITLHDLKGCCVTAILDKRLAAGNYRLLIDKQPLSSKMYVIHVVIDTRTMVIKQLYLEGKFLDNSFIKTNNTVPVTPQIRELAAIDTIIVSKIGYATVRKPIDDYIGTVDIVMAASGFTVTSHTIDVSADPVEDKDGVGWGNAPHPQIILKPWKDSCFAIAWNDKSDAVHITKIDQVRQPVGNDIVFMATVLGGFTVTPTGFGITAVRDSMLFVIGVNEDGSRQFETQLIGFKPHNEYQAKFDPMAFGSSRLHFADSKFAAYYAHQQQYSENPDSSEVHQGDMLVFLDTDGNKLTGGWNWGTSHSLDERIDHDGQAFVTVSLGDAYPKGITFQRVGEINKKTIMQLDANMGGWANGDLGGLVILDEGYVVAFCSPQGRDTTDAGFMCVDADGTVLRTVWLTENKKGTGKKLNRVSTANYGDSLVFVAWNMYDNSTKADTAYAAALDFSGKIITGPDRLDDTFNIGDDFVTLPDGDVAWAIAENGKLKIVRVEFIR